MTGPSPSSEQNEQREIITPPTNLQHLARKTPGDNKLDLTVLMKAELALEKISSQYSDWMEKEVSSLRDMRNDINASGFTAENLSKLFFLMQNLKDCAAPFGYPYVAKIASSLCDIIEDVKTENIPQEIVNAHLSAVLAIVNEHAKGENFLAGQLAAHLHNATQIYFKSLQP